VDGGERGQHGHAAAVDEPALQGRAESAAERQGAGADARGGERAGDLAHVEEDRQPADADRHAADEGGQHDHGDAGRAQDARVDAHAF
jgi:hypothetical protein